MKGETNVFAMLLVCVLMIPACFQGEVAKDKSASSLKQVPASAPVYSVSEYSFERNPDEDLKLTVNQAKAEGKRILLLVGGDWCSWCGIMDTYFHENEAVANVLARGFIIMKVNISRENKNAEFLGRFPKTSAYPHLFVLGEDGEFLHSQNTEELELDSSYREVAVLDFLESWAPKR